MVYVLYYTPNIIEPIARIATVAINIRTSNFVTNFIHVEYSILAIAKPPITTPDVGVIKFTIPLPAENAETTISGAIFNLSANGANIGIETEANPEVDGIKNDNAMYIKYAILANSIPDTPLSIPDALSSINKSNPEFAIINDIPLDIPTTKATPTISAHPDINDLTISSSDILHTNPITIAIIKNQTVNSGNHQVPSEAPLNHDVLSNIVTPKSFQGITLIIITTNEKANKPNATFCFPLNSNISPELLSNASLASFNSCLDNIDLPLSL